MNNDTLSALPFFRGLAKEERHQLLKIAEHVQFDKGEKLVTQGQMQRNLWIVLEGQCQVTRRTESGCQVNLAELGPNKHFGEMSFFHAAPNSADVIALTEIALLRISRTEFDRLSEENREVVLKLTENCIEQMAERLRRMDQWITELVCGCDQQPSATEWSNFRAIIFGRK